MVTPTGRILSKETPNHLELTWLFNSLFSHRIEFKSRRRNLVHNRRYSFRVTLLFRYRPLLEAIHGLHFLCAGPGSLG
jgi:hypothetical protein